MIYGLLPKVNHVLEFMGKGGIQHFRGFIQKIGVNVKVLAAVSETDGGISSLLGSGSSVIVFGPEIPQSSTLLTRLVVTLNIIDHNVHLCSGVTARRYIYQIPCIYHLVRLSSKYVSNGLVHQLKLSSKFLSLGRSDFAAVICLRTLIQHPDVAIVTFSPQGCRTLGIFAIRGFF